MYTLVSTLLVKLYDYDIHTCVDVILVSVHVLTCVFSNCQEDFILMCNNCMTYNPEDTVFYQAAKKLLSSGLKLIAKVVTT